MAKKHRSPAYPAIDLKEAVKLVRRIYPAASHAIGGDAIAIEWGYKSLGSATSQIAALKQYGLLVEERGGGDRLFKLSELALDIAVDDSEESEECRNAIQAASLKPRIHKDLMDKWGDQLPPDAEIRRYLIRERAFNPKYVSRFMSSYKATVGYAGNICEGENDGDDDVDTANNGNGPKTPTTEVQVGSFVQWTSQGADRFPEPRRVAGVDGEWAFVEGSQTGIPMNELNLVDAPKYKPVLNPPANPFYSPSEMNEKSPKEGMAQDRTTLDEGAVQLDWPDALSEDSVEEFQDWMIGRINRARRKAGLGKIKIEDS